MWIGKIMRKLSGSQTLLHSQLLKRTIIWTNLRLRQTTPTVETKRRNKSILLLCFANSLSFFLYLSSFRFVFQLLFLNFHVCKFFHREVRPSARVRKWWAVLRNAPPKMSSGAVTYNWPGIFQTNKPWEAITQRRNSISPDILSELHRDLYCVFLSRKELLSSSAALLKGLF